MSVYGGELTTFYNRINSKWGISGAQDSDTFVNVGVYLYSLISSKLTRARSSNVLRQAIWRSILGYDFKRKEVTILDYEGCAKFICSPLSGNCSINLLRDHFMEVEVWVDLA